uniref:RHS repeat-associated core domain-containing protein n=1 Tax=Marinimicrobium sp. C2-29 TaxID=3139825 RepID=UPI003139397D
MDTPDTSIEYRHNALGQRVAKLIDGEIVERYLWQDLTTLLATYDGSGSLKQRFEYTMGHTPTSFTQGGQRYYIQTDHLGSPRAVTDSSGSVVKTIRYDSYGNITDDRNPEFDIPFGFAGGLRDPDTGLIRFGYRDYDPETGRWTARDPIGFEGGDPNLYGYVLKNPISFRDPYGLAPWWASPLAAVTAVVGGSLMVAGGTVAAPVGLGLVVVAGGLQIWDWATTPTEQAEEAKEKARELEENMDKLQDKIDSIDGGDSCS